MTTEAVSIREEIADLRSYLAGLPEALRAGPYADTGKVTPAGNVLAVLQTGGMFPESSGGPPCRPTPATTRAVNS